MIETKKVLIIEDNADIADIYNKFFKLFYEDISVDHVIGGLEALEKALTDDYSLIICDIQIPEINGIEFFKRLKMESPKSVCKVLFITAGIEKYENTFLEKQECPYIAKPFTKDIFIEKVNSILHAPL
ncbi:MAG: response regulator [Deltaproteobacteria bacterium]|nr:response regulator [Deltaproteobacteria bacterium]